MISAEDLGAFANALAIFVVGLLTAYHVIQSSASAPRSQTGPPHWLGCVAGGMEHPPRALKFKGDSGVSKKKKKKKKSKDAESKAAPSAEAAAKQDDTASEDVIAGPAKTEAQRKHEEWLAKHEAARLKKAAAKSHRERIQEYNDRLSKLTEHNDIPKVGPGQQPDVIRDDLGSITIRRDYCGSGHRSGGSWRRPEANVHSQACTRQRRGFGLVLDIREAEISGGNGS
eukprot:TRINITY_DN832_c1_g1_i1.p1 TRINITY_DN832_c1_g1~~TRINITY_DN832_c1_g1_i1.p1  ORF type:complete len:228 (-),score=31.18 TRINITY_DN832_c1_g1_i1:232-915(-)